MSPLFTGTSLCKWPVRPVDLWPLRCLSGSRHWMAALTFWVSFSGSRWRTAALTRLWRTPRRVVTPTHGLRTVRRWRRPQVWSKHSTQNWNHSDWTRALAWQEIRSTSAQSSWAGQSLILFTSSDYQNEPELISPLCFMCFLQDSSGRHRFSSCGLILTAGYYHHGHRSGDSFDPPAARRNLGLHPEGGDGHDDNDLRANQLTASSHPTRQRRFLLCCLTDDITLLKTRLSQPQDWGQF